MADATVALTGNVTSASIGVIRSSAAPGQLFDFQTPAAAFEFGGVTGVSGEFVVAPTGATLEFTGRTATAGSLAAATPFPSFAFAGTAGTIGTLAAAFDMPAVAFYSVTEFGVNLPSPQVALAGTTGAVGDMTVNTAALQVSLAGDSQTIGALALVPPLVRLQLDGSVGNAARLETTLKVISLALDGYTGVLGSLTLSMPVADVTLEGVHEAQGEVLLTVPALYLQMTGSSARVSAPITLTMHTETLALTSYDNYPFNSFTTFNGVYLGASADGVFALVGDTDAGVPIQAMARVGISDFGTSFLKRVDRIYVGHRATGPMVLRVITEEVNQRDYLLAQAPNSGLHGAHIRVGKGVTARYWQFELRNQNGADFSADIIELKPTKLGRRVGGGNA